MFCLVPTTFGSMEQERGIANRLPSTSITDSILLVDDQKVNLKLLKKQVELIHPHATVLLAKDGLEATELFEEHVGKIKLVLIDYHTPRMDGKEATRRMRAMEAERGVVPCHIYLLTADSVEKSERTSIAVGVTDILLKPLKLDLLRTL
jgi:CheY-like chemotaxis protein